LAGKRILDLVISGNATGATTALRQTSDASGKSGAAISTAMLAAGAAVLAFGLKSAATFSNVGTETLKVQRLFGGTAEEASKLRAVANLAGVGVDTLTTSAARLSKALGANPALMQQFGTYAQDATGKMRPLGELLPVIADRFATMPNGIEKNALAMQLFGRSGTEMIPFLNRGAEGLKELGDKAEQMGLVLSGPQLQAVRDNKMAQREFSGALEGLQVQIGARVLPMLTSLATTATNLVGPLSDLVNPVTIAAGGLIALVGVGSKVVTMFGPATMAILNFSAGVAGVSLTTLIGALGITAAGATAVYLAWNKMNGELAEQGSALQTEVRTVALAGSFADLESRLGTAQAASARFNDEWQNSGINIIDGIGAALANNNLQPTIRDLERLRDQTVAVADASGISRDRAVAWLAEQERLGRTFATTEEAVAAYTGRVDTSTMSAEEATAAMKDQADQLKFLNDELRASVDPLFAMQRAMIANSEAQVKSKEAGDAAWLAQTNLNDVTRRYAADSPEVAAAIAANDAAQRALTTANLAGADSAIGVTSAANNLSFAMQNNGLSVEGAKAQLETWVTQGILTRAQADNISGSFGWLAGAADNLNNRNVAIPVNAPGLDYAIGQFVTLGNKVREMTGLGLTAGVSTNLSSFGGPRASGGPVMGGSTYLVGEQGPELFTPSGSGFIHDARTTSGMGGSWKVTIVQQPGESTDALVDRLDRWARQNGRRPVLA
jgi:hypothetical protein